MLCSVDSKDIVLINEIVNKYCSICKRVLLDKDQEKEELNLYIVLHL